MPPRKNTAATTGTKTKAPKRSTVSGRISKPRTRLGEDPPPRPVVPEDEPRDAGNEPAEYAGPVPGVTASLQQLRQLETSMDERFEQLDASFQSSYHDLGAMIDDKFGQLLQRLNSQPHIDQVNERPLLGLGMTGTAPAAGDDVLSRWYWLERSTIEAIDLGTFDINQLPKLQREESARNRHLAKAAEGFRMSLDGSKIELITTQTKLYSAFPSLQRYLSAWQIYVSVRTQYHPEYSSGLAFWTERLIFRASLHPWDVVLNYAIAYFQAHQRDAPSYWFRPDSDLITDTILSSRPSIPHTSSSALRTGSHSSPTRATSGYGSNICQNWNKSKCTVKETTGYDCMRRHICNTCMKDDHRAPQCPQKQNARTPG